MKTYKVTFKIEGNEHSLLIPAYSKYNAKTRLYKMHPSAELVKIEEEQQDDSES